MSHTAFLSALLAFALTSNPAWADSKFTLGPDVSVTGQAFGLFQGNYGWTKAEGGPTDQGFAVGLARLGMTGTIALPEVTYLVQAQVSTAGNTNQVSLIDGWMACKVDDLLKIKGGRTVLAYSRQLYANPGELLFGGLSSADLAFDLPYSTGLELSGSVRGLSYFVAAVNSVRALDGSGQTNAQNAVAGVARLNYDILDVYGYKESLAKSVDTPALSVGLGAAINPVQEGSRIQNTAKGDDTQNATADLGFRWKRFTLQSALYNRYTHRNSWGSYVQAGFLLTPEKWELAVRRSSVDFGENTNGQTWAKTRDYSIGFNRYIKGHDLKLQSDYTFSQLNGFDGRRENDHAVHIQAQFMF